MKRIRLLSVLALCLFPLSLSAALPFNAPFLPGQNNASPAPEKKPVNDKEIEALRTQLGAEITQAREALATAPADLEASHRQFLSSRLQTLESLDQVYG